MVPASDDPRDPYLFVSLHVLAGGRVGNREAGDEQQYGQNGGNKNTCHGMAPVKVKVQKVQSNAEFYHKNYFLSMVTSWD